MTDGEVSASGTRSACQLVELTEKDLDALLALERTCPSTAWSEAQWAVALADTMPTKGGTSVLGIWCEQQLAGYAVLVDLGIDAELQAIMVAPAWRCRGLGQRLLAGVIERAELWAELWASERLLLEVRASNAAALAMYYQAGFALDGVRKNYYPLLDSGGREDACLMSLCLVRQV